MIRSIRGRLQLWYALVLLAVVAGFGGLLYWSVRSARLEDIDQQLEAATNYLKAGLRGFPRPDLDPPRPGSAASDGGRSGGSGGKGKGRGPDKRSPHGISPKHLELLYRELTLPPALEGRAATHPDDLPYFIVWRRDDSVLKASALPNAAPVTLAELSFPATESETLITQQGSHRQVTCWGLFGTRILVGKSVRQEIAALNTFTWQLASFGGLVFAVGVLGGWLTSARGLRPLAAFSAKAASISATHLSERIDLEDIDSELLQLAGVLNAMFARLESAFERQRRFTADASHELRTPLTILHTNIELALARPRSEEEYRATLAACREASARMRALVEGLLTLARADADRLDLRSHLLDLRDPVEETLTAHGNLAGSAGIKLLVATPSGPVSLLGDAPSLARVLTNLLANALRHTPAGGWVQVSLTSEEGQAILTVTDTGCGIPEEDQPRIFERFFRVDQARTRGSGGNGLGLAICKCLIEAHGGTIGVSSRLNEGSCFTVRLPLAKEGPHAAG